MAVFGSTINPALGRVDYSPLAQGLAMGGQLAAQGMSNFGQGVTQGIQSFLRNQEEKKNEQEGIAFIKSQMPGIDDATAKAGLKAAGGAAAFVKFKSDMAAQQDADRMRRLQLSEMERQAAEQSRLNAAMTASPAQQAITAGSSFENLPTGTKAFLPSAPTSTYDFINRATSSGASPSTWLPQAIQFSQLEENVAQARQRMANKPELGYPTPEGAFSKAAEMAKGRTGVSPSFTVAQGRYFPAFREEQPGAFEKEADKLRAQSAQKRLDQFTNDYDLAIAAGNSATMVLEGLNAGKKTGIFTPFVNFANRLFEGAGIKDSKVAADQILAKGIAGAQAATISLLARGLGSMSNADREFYVATTPGITDETLSNRYFSEMAKENEKFAKQDRELVRQMQRNKVDTEEIVRKIEELRENRNVARDIYRRVIGGGISQNASQYLN